MHTSALVVVPCNVSAFGCVFLAEVNAHKAHVGIFQVA